MTVPPFLRRTWQVIRRGSEIFPLTPLGIGVAAAGAFAFVTYGIRKVDLVLFALAGIAVVVAALAFLATTLTAIVLAIRMRGVHEKTGLRLECGIPTKTEFSLSSLWYVPFVSVKWTWVEPHALVDAPARAGRLQETATPQRRGSYSRVRRRIDVSDAFRLTKITLLYEESRSVNCLPSVGALAKMNVVRSLSNGDDYPNPTSAAEGDRSDLRRYSPGDPVRFILWRVFAKTRQIVIKVPERAQSVATKAVAYLVAGEGDEAAAGAARLTLESGALGKDWVFGVDGSNLDAKTLDGAHGLIAASVNATPEQTGAGLASFMDRNARAGRVLVFCPALNGDWLARVVAAAARRVTSGSVPNVEFLVCCDGIDRSTMPSWMRRITLAPEESKGTEIVSLASSTEVLRALAGTRARVMLVDRRAGRFHQAAEQLRLADNRALEPRASAAAAPGTAS